ncbi:HET-domain-containing protein, partial [Corynespora cassiicola Philippines]
DRIRVLELHPGEFDDPISVSLTMHLMSDEPEYEALSYAWGTDICDKPILVDGYPLKVNVNLDTALRHLRYVHESRFLWIDAICINQHSTTERNHQVQLMGTIYPNARDVLVWLGPAADSSDF